VLTETGIGRIASLVGRYYAMDRDNRWERVKPAYDLLTSGQADHQADEAVIGLQAAYARDENDEFVAATCIGERAPMNDGDAVLFFNFRADRAREITRAFIEPDFDGFDREATPQLSHFVCLTEYHADFDAPVAYPPEAIVNGLGEYVSSCGKTQLRIAETEKYAHVSFFFSGGKDAEYAGETRTLVPSPDVATYDLKPEMSAPEVTDHLVEAITSQAYDLIVCNYANPDMVGHTGVFDAAVKAVEAIDECLGRVREALEQVGGEMLVTADHGNVELMHDHDTGQAHTAHTTFTVPLVYFGPQGNKAQLRSGGSLQDIAPSLLQLMGLPQPAEMTGQSLIVKANEEGASA
jgi:2,3-bisphosphoglycerate-independent phosphoglycerate mutase